MDRLPGESIHKYLRRIEETLVRNALEQNDYSLTKAAAHLGIPIGTLQGKMRKYNIIIQRRVHIKPSP